MTSRSTSCVPRSNAAGARSTDPGGSRPRASRWPSPSSRSRSAPSLASASGVLFVRVLLRLGVRSVGARVADGARPDRGAGRRPGHLLPRRAPAAALMLPADAVDALPVPVSDGYVHFAQTALPLLVATWALVAGDAARPARRSPTAAPAASPGPPSRPAVPHRPPCWRRWRRCRRALRVQPPTIAVAPTCPGGAYVVGTRRPTVGRRAGPARAARRRGARGRPRARARARPSARQPRRDRPRRGP